MLDNKDFSFLENQNTFDFKGFLIKTASYWRWFLASLVIAFTIAHQVNIRKEKIYVMDTTVVVKEENNPFFTSNTSLVFNWGGTSDQIQNISSTIKSRSHNELVVEKLDYYIDYLVQDDYYTRDAYGAVPFYISLDKKNANILNQAVYIKFVTPSEFTVRLEFSSASVEAVYYEDNKRSDVKVAEGEFIKRFKVGEKIALPFLNLAVEMTDQPGNYIGNEYIVKFRNFDDVVASYRGIGTDIDAKAGSLITLSLQGTNKTRMVDYLNETVKTLIKSQLDRKNQFATNTIAFIDSTLAAMDNQLKVSEGEMKAFTKDKNVFEMEADGSMISGNLLQYDVQKDGILRKIAYLNSLNNYLRNSVDFAKLPAPSVAGIDDPNISANVSKIIALSAERSELAYTVKSERLFKDFDVQIEALKRVLIENIKSAKKEVDYDLSLVNSKIAGIESDIRKLPSDKQEYVKIKRKYDLSESIINSFLAKRNEAEIVKAANLSDIHFIDSAKDIGRGLVGPNTSVNYILAAFLGMIIPLLIIFALFFIEDSILNTDDITRNTNIPIIGVIGLKTSNSNLTVFEKPKSALSESFRAIRSSLQFIYKKNNLEHSKTLLLTSSISGEGKTYCSINLGTVFALSGKKTILVGLDLRKPKIFEDFGLTNDIGVVNYLIGQSTFDEVIFSTSVPNLDVVSSGPIPPNPSELLIGDAMAEFINKLKEKYDYILLDTPPVGLVSDAVELSQFADVTLYVVRQNYTKKEMIRLLNNRTERKELTNVSIVFNGYQNKAKYGSGYGDGYGYGYGYGYCTYAQGYHDDEEDHSIMGKIKRTFRKK